MTVLHAPDEVTVATCANDGIRDGKKAVELATKAYDLSESKDADYLQTLAAAHAENGNFKEAVKRQQEAIALGIEDSDAMKRARNRLKLYQDNKPYREE